MGASARGEPDEWDLPAGGAVVTGQRDAAGLAARIVVQRARFAVEASIEVASGETVAIMGPSGAGKSTLLEALAGLVRLDEGEISVGGRTVDRVAAPRVHTPAMRRGVVLLGQDPRLFPHLSARENVAFGPRAGGVPKARARAEADAWLARVGLPGAGDRRPGDLSGGEQQRVAVARALAAAPRVVLLDEPLVALDPDTASAIREMLRDQLAGTTTVAVTHDAVDAVALADRLVVVEEGRVVQSGAVREVLGAPASRFVASIAGVNRVVGTVVAGGWERDGVRLEGEASAALEDGTALAAVFRPADVEVLPDPVLRPNAWDTAIVRLEPTPAGVRVQTEWCAVDLPVLAAARLSVGDIVSLRVPPEAVRFVAA